MFPTKQVGKIMLSGSPAAWEMSGMTDVEDLRGRKLYDALMALKPAALDATVWAVEAGVNRGFFTNLKSQPISPRADTLRKLLRHIGKTEAQLYSAASGTIDKGPDIPPARSADAGEAVSIMRMDLSYAMGPGTNLDDSYIEGEPIVFDLSFLRGLTRADPSMLRIVDGVGDSMFPTIPDREMLIIDLSQRTLNMQDRIWAISLYGAGALKRLRSISKDRVLVISDNPDVPDQEVDTSDITIAGRLVGSIKRH